MIQKNKHISSGIKQLDKLLGGGIIIGDNVVWYDDAGSLAYIFSLKFIQASMAKKKPLIYLSFDRSMKNLLEQLGPLAKNPSLTILDCFTHGKGKGSDIFLEFYKKKSLFPCQIIRIDEPGNADNVMETLFELHKTMKGDVRFVFESLTGMQELWGDEAHILKFYSHSCPRLYELNTIAYWIVEKGAHSERLKVHINKITQVAIDLSIKRGKTSLSILKADKRDLDIINKPCEYWNTGLDITFDSGRRLSNKINIGIRLKKIRTKKGVSQTELAKLVGVSPSSISQIESNQIYPSLPALMKMAEILSIDMASFFMEPDNSENRVVFSESNAIDVQLPGLPKDSICSKLLTAVGFDSRIEPYLIEIQPKTKISSHFFIHKGVEMGYLLEGELQLIMASEIKKVHAGNVIYLTAEMPSQWENTGSDLVRLFWIKINY